MHRAIEPHPHHLCQAARIVAACLVDLCLQHRPHVPRLNADHRQARFRENAVKPMRQRSGFQSNSLEAIDGVRQHLQEGFRLTRHPRFPHDLARIIHDADARFLDRHIESSKIGHAALLLLMLEAADATSFHHQPGAQHPNFQLSTSWQADYPIFGSEAAEMIGTIWRPIWFKLPNGSLLSIYSTPSLHSTGPATIASRRANSVTSVFSGEPKRS